MAKDKIDWVKVDIDDFPPKVRKLWEAWRDAQEAAKAAREPFIEALEEAANKQAPEGFEARIATRFGADNVAVAYAEPAYWTRSGSKGKGEKRVKLFGKSA